MAEDTAAAVQTIASKGAPGSFVERVKFYMKQPDLRERNAKDVWIADEARVVAEILVLGLEVRPQSFWHTRDVGTDITDLEFFGVKSSATTLHTTNMPAAGEFAADQIFFVKQFTVFLDHSISQADKRVILQNFLVTFGMYDKTYLEELVRHLPGGAGLDGELTNGVPDIRNIYTLKSYLRIPASQSFAATLKRMVACAVGGNVTVTMKGLYGRRK